MKNWLSRVGVAEAFGVGEGVGDGVCARTSVAIEKIIAERIMPKRHCGILLLLMFPPYELLFRALLFANDQHYERAGLDAALWSAAGSGRRSLNVFGCR